MIHDDDAAHCWQLLANFASLDGVKAARLVSGHTRCDRHTLVVWQALQSFFMNWPNSDCSAVPHVLCCAGYCLQYMGQVGSHLTLPTTAPGPPFQTALPSHRLCLRSCHWEHGVVCPTGSARGGATAGSGANSWGCSLFDSCTFTRIVSWAFSQLSLIALDAALLSSHCQWFHLAIQVQDITAVPLPGMWHCHIGNVVA